MIFRVRSALRKTMAFAWGVSLLPSVVAAAPTALFVSGGGGPSSNFCRYYDNIKRAQEQFGAWDKTNLVADGPPGGTPNTVGCDSQLNELRDPATGLPIFVEKQPVGGNQGPATVKGLKTALLAKIKDLKPGDPVLLYFTDHGSSGGGTSKTRTVVLWGEELEESQLQQLMDLIPKKNKIVVVNDQCFGGGMVEALFNAKGRPRRPGTCGFAAAGPDELAYDGGGFMKATEKILKSTDADTFKVVENDQPGDPGYGSYSFDEVHRYMQKTYSTISTSVSSGGLFLRHYLEDPKNKPEKLLGARLEIRESCLMFRKGLAQGMDFLPDVSTVLLQQRLQSLRVDLETYYGYAGVSENASYEMIGTKMAALEKANMDRERDMNAAKVLRRLAFVDFMKDASDGPQGAQRAQLFANFETTKARMDELQQKVDQTQGPLKLKVELAIEQAKYTAYSNEIERYRHRELRGDGGALKAWIAKSGGPPKPYSKNQWDEAEKAADAYSNGNTTLQGYRRLYNSLTDFNAIRAMIRNKDTEAMTQYLDMLECEHTPIAPTPKAQMSGGAK